MVFWAEMPSAVESAVCIGPVDVRLLLWVSSVTADTLQCHFGKKGIRLGGLDQALLGFFLSQHSRLYAQETQHPASPLVGLECEVTSSDMAFPLLWRTKSLLWPF